MAGRMITVPGIGPLVATANAIPAQPPETVRKAENVAAWPSLDVLSTPSAINGRQAPRQPLMRSTWRHFHLPTVQIRTRSSNPCRRDN